jgi:hypothetical protein
VGPSSKALIEDEWRTQSVANWEAKHRGLIFLHEDAKQLPWNDILAEKHRGAGGASTETLTFPAGLFGDEANSSEQSWSERAPNRARGILALLAWRNW